MTVTDINSRKERRADLGSAEKMLQLHNYIHERIFDLRDVQTKLLLTDVDLELINKVADDWARVANDLKRDALTLRAQT